MRKEIVIDIETLPCANDVQIKYLMDSVKADSRIKDPAKIEADIAEKRNEVIGKTGLDGSFGRVLMVSISDVSSDDITTIHSDDEVEVLALVQAEIGRIVNSTGHTPIRPVIIGHNVAWDLRFLAQRCVVNGVHIDKKLLPFDSKPWGDEMADTMAAWCGVGNRITLDRLCVALGVESPKSEMDGSMVSTYYADGRLNEIIAYNRADVKATKQCYLKMKLAGIV